MTRASQEQCRPADEAASPSVEYTPRFVRNRWTHPGLEIDRFFDSFVPRQYEEGFAWRCRVIGQGEEARIKPFEEQSGAMQRLIAGNAEVLLELLEETKPTDLDLMRAAGKGIAELGLIRPEQELAPDIPALREDMSRRHHEKWWDQFKVDLAAGRRTDADHRGARPFEELSPVERLIMKVQTWGNWRILGALSDDEYSIVRKAAEARSAASA